MADAPATASSTATAEQDRQAFGVAKDFRRTHGEAAFEALARAAFIEADLDGSGAIDKKELRETLKKLGIRLAGQTAGVLQYYDKDENGQMEEAEFMALVSDIIDGRFDLVTGKMAAEKLAAQQQEHMKTQHEQATQLLQQQADQMQVQVQPLVDQVTRLTEENRELKKTIVEMKKKMKKFENNAAAQKETDARAKKEAIEQAKIAAMEARMSSKMGM